VKLHVLGICGTFMGGVAALARERGDLVEGSDRDVYPPMSTQLEALGIALKQGYLPEHLSPDCDQVVVGNALSRGNPAVEALLDSGRAYTSGAQWLAERILPGRRTLAVAGTHGKTTTSSLLAWILAHAGRQPGFLIGGVPRNFPASARLGAGDCFVVEADEYDTAFFDKRSKFVHYRPEVAVLNNLEYDHADIFPDLAAIQRQFHHLVRTVPGKGRLIVNAEDAALAEVLAMGAWTPVERFAIDAEAEWQASLLDPSGAAFVVRHRGETVGEVRWTQLGRHNVMNALAAIAAANAVGVSPAQAIAALPHFLGPRRRLELLADAGDIRVYDDFAHHPTAIATTLAGLAAANPGRRVLAVLEPRSNSMRLGAHAAALGPALDRADQVFLLRRPDLPWDAEAILQRRAGRGAVAPTVDALLEAVKRVVQPGDRVLFMSNGGFEAAPQRFAEWVNAARG
jgi:UDP-N-acetylmuramate: L-alanyl-gamma-D-glutamyl-meso-diaminopimelate ligase